MERPTETVDIRRGYARPTIAPHVDLRLDANEGPSVAPAIVEAARSLDPDALRRYPEVTALEEEFAARLGVQPARVLATAGADDAIDRLCRTQLTGGGELVLPLPSFEMFERYARLVGGTIRRVEWPEGTWPTEAILAAVTPRTRMIACVSPNNPTGAVASPEELRRVATACPGVLVVLDHAYAEFADVDLTDGALELPNVVVLRTLSKAWSLAGLRVGFAVGSPERITELRAGGAPYAVSGVAIAMAIAALRGARADMEASVARVRRERADLVGMFDELGLRALPSQANFVLVACDDPTGFDAGMQALGIKVRVWPGHPDLGRVVRVTCPSDDGEFARLRRSLRSLLRPQALLLDMDGVIADEGESYREAIRATLADFDVHVDRARIAQVKSEGHANDDWIVTHRLLTEAGVRIELEEVIRRFEAHYQGDGEREGLYVRERPLVSRALLERLRDRRPLGIVTGRPEQDAMRFLERFELLDLFDAVVTLDDVRCPKPDPEPARLALTRLGVESAWMVGDTPDDIVAARAAGVLPIAILPPTASDAVSADRLRAAGCAHLLDRFADLLESMP